MAKPRNRGRDHHREISRRIQPKAYRPVTVKLGDQEYEIDRTSPVNVRVYRIVNGSRRKVTSRHEAELVIEGVVVEHGKRGRG